MNLSDKMCRRIGIALTTTGAVLLIVCLTQYFSGVVFLRDMPFFPSLGLVVVGASLLIVAWTGEV